MRGKGAEGVKSEKVGECFFAIVQRASRTRKALLTTSKRALDITVGVRGFQRAASFHRIPLFSWSSSIYDVSSTRIRIPSRALISLSSTLPMENDKAEKNHDDDDRDGVDVDDGGLLCKPRRPEVAALISRR